MSRSCRDCARIYDECARMCTLYEMQDDYSAAETCNYYIEGKRSKLTDDEYVPSATAGDYSPSCPANDTS